MTPVEEQPIAAPAAAAGLRVWFDELFLAHRDDIHRYAVRRVGAEAADDVVSEVFLTAWRRRDSVPVDAARLWLFGVAGRVVANQRRGEHRATRLRDRLAAEPVSAPAPGSDDRVLDALAALRPQDQELLRLTEWDQLTAEEVATVLDIRPETVRVRLHRARQRFAAALNARADDGGDDDADH